MYLPNLPSSQSKTRTLVLPPCHHTSSWHGYWQDKGADLIKPESSFYVGLFCSEKKFKMVSITQIFQTYTR